MYKKVAEKVFDYKKQLKGIIHNIYNICHQKQK